MHTHNAVELVIITGGVAVPAKAVDRQTVVHELSIGICIH